MVAQKKKQSKKPATRKGKGRKDQTAEVVRFKKLRAKIGQLKSTCGTLHKLRVPNKLVPLLGIFANFGTCSIEVTITGVGNPVSVMIPSMGGWDNREVLLHPFPAAVTIECLPTVPGGDCRVGYILIW